MYSSVKAKAVTVDNNNYTMHNRLYSRISCSQKKFVSFAHGAVLNGIGSRIHRFRSEAILNELKMS